MLGIKRRASCMLGNHVPHWTISPAPSNMFSRLTDGMHICLCFCPSHCWTIFTYVQTFKKKIHLPNDRLTISPQNNGSVSLVILKQSTRLTSSLAFTQHAGKDGIVQTPSSPSPGLTWPHWRLLQLSAARTGAVGSAGKRDAVGPGREKLCEKKCINKPWVLFISKYTLATKLKNNNNL